VDVFFVLSGYLITSLIWRDFSGAKGKGLLAQLSRFWARRARRLLPAALLVLVSTFLAGLWLGPKTWWLDSSGSFFASGAYVANWYFGFEATEYLRADAAVSPYQHFWSLSVEEQFYVLWPLLVMLVVFSSVARKLRLTIGLMAVISLLSFGYGLYLYEADPSFAFYNTFGRIWEFGFGALLALLQVTRKISVPKIFFPLSWAGLVAIMFVSHDSQSLIWITLVAVLLTTLAVISSEGRLADRWLRPLHLVGDYSYGIYLWHWPVFILAPWVIGASAVNAGLFEQAMLVLVALLLAVASKHLVEDPLRFGGFAKFKNLTQIGMLLGLSVLILLSFAHIERSVREEIGTQVSTSVQPGEQPTKALTPPLADIAEDKPLVEGAEYLIRKDKEGFRVAELGVVGSEKRIAIVGDSHARQYYDPLAALAEKYSFQLDVISKSACSIQHPESYALDGHGAGLFCEDWNRQLAEYLETASYDLLVSSNSTLVHDGDQQAGESYAQAVSSWVDLGFEVLVIRDNPKPVVNDEVLDFRYCIEEQGPNAEEVCGTEIGRALEPFDSLFVAASEVAGVNALDLTDVYCDGDWCPVIIDGVILYRDGSHITVTFAKTLEDELEYAIVNLGL
jgi:peptidoglycan/LPS O-acetylase OafA/YrhL